MTINMSPFGQIEQGVHYIRKYLIYSSYEESVSGARSGRPSKFNEKSYHDV